MWSLLIFINTFFHYPVLLLLSGSTSTGHGSLPGGVTQIYILEGLGPLAILPELDCYSFSLTLFTGHGNTKRCPKGSPVFLTSHVELQYNYPLGSQD